MWGIGKIVRRLERIEDALSMMGADVTTVLERIAVAQESQVWYNAGRPAGIRSININDTGDDSMAVSNVTVELLPGKPTAVSQVATVAVAGFVTREIVVPVPDVLVKFAVAPGSVIDMTVASRDAAGNTSSAVVIPSFAADDDTAPDAPDGIASFSVNDTEVPDVGFLELVPL